jgi:hypothetical protein
MLINVDCKWSRFFSANCMHTYTGVWVTEFNPWRSTQIQYCRSRSTDLFYHKYCPGCPVAYCFCDDTLLFQFSCVRISCRSTYGHLYCFWSGLTWPVIIWCPLCTGSSPSFSRWVECVFCKILRALSFCCLIFPSLITGIALPSVLRLPSSVHAVILTRKRGYLLVSHYHSKLLVMWRSSVRILPTTIISFLKVTGINLVTARNIPNHSHHRCNCSRRIIKNSRFIIINVRKVSIRVLFHNFRYLHSRYSFILYSWEVCNFSSSNNVSKWVSCSTV